MNMTWYFEDGPWGQDLPDGQFEPRGTIPAQLMEPEAATERPDSELLNDRRSTGETSISEFGGIHGPGASLEYFEDDSAAGNEDIPLFLRPKASTSVENDLNKMRLESYRSDYEAEFLRTLRESHFEPGLDSDLDAFFRHRLSENASVTREWLSTLFVENFGNEFTEVALLSVVGHLEYEQVKPAGISMAMAGLTHESDLVVDSAIRAMENWGTMECLEILKKVKCEQEWMRDYVSQVIEDLEEYWADARTG